MAVYSLLVVLVGVALCVDHVTGLHSERQEERKRGRGRLHQFCQKLLDGEAVSSESLRTAHDSIRHRRHKNKCKMHMRAEERCIKRYKPSNSTVHSFHDNFYGWVVNISCIRGYELKGRPFVKCYEDLHKAEKPFCQIRDCGHPTYNNDTAYIYNTTTFGSRLRVRCGRDFNLTGPSSAKCLASGRWMAISRCVKLECHDPKPPHYGTYHDTKNAQNVRTVSFECVPGYRLLGHSEVTCQNGTWAPNASVKCVPIPKEKDTSTFYVIAICVLTVVVLLIGGVLIKWALKLRKKRTRSTSRAGYAERGRFLSSMDSKLGFDGISFSKTTGKSDSGFNDSCPDFERSRTSLLGYPPRNDTASSIPMSRLNNCVKLNGYEYITIDRGESADVPDQATVSPQRTTKCKEYIYPTKTVKDPVVCLVTPLYAGNDNNNDDDFPTDQDPPETEEELPQSADENTCTAVSLKLNWNLLFQKLVPRVCTANWKLFAIHLLSSKMPSTGHRVDTIISRIEIQSKIQNGGDNIEVILFKILWYWQSNSKNPRLADIETALNLSQHEDVFHDMNNITKNCYVPDDDGEDGVIDKNNGLAGIPELKYRPIAQRQTITSFPCIEGMASLMEAERGSHVTSPVVPYTEHVTWDYQFASHTGGFPRHNRYYRNYRTTSTNRRFSYSPYQKLRNKYKFDPRKKIPVKSKSKVPLLQNKPKTPRAAVAISFTANDKMYVDLILRILDLKPETILNWKEYQILTKYTIHKIRDIMSANASLDDLFGITFDEYKASEHVSTTQSGNLHIISSGELRVILMGDVWTLVERYVRGARNAAVCRDTDNGGNYLFLTYEGKQITVEYFHEKINDTTYQNETDTQDQDPDVKPTQSIDMDTDADDEPGKKEMCTATMQSFDCKTESPVSHNSDYVQCTKQVTKNEKINDTADQTDNDTQDQDPDVKQSERSIDMDTDAEDQPGNKEMCTATMQSFDCQAESPVPRNSEYAQRTKQEPLLGKDNNVIHHGRRYFSENQKSTIEAMFKREIRQGSVKESDILEGFNNAAGLREVLGVQSKEVPNILVKKVADRVRCFIRKRKQQH